MELKSIDMERDMSSWRERLCLALLEFVLPHSETWAEASERNERQMMVDFIVVMYWYWGCGFANECDVMRLEIEFYNGDPQAGTRSLSSYLFSQRNFFLIRATDELVQKFKPQRPTIHFEQRHNHKHNCHIPDHISLS